MRLELYGNQSSGPLAGDLVQSAQGELLKTL